MLMKLPQQRLRESLVLNSAEVKVDPQHSNPKSVSLSLISIKAPIVHLGLIHPGEHSCDL